MPRSNVSVVLFSSSFVGGKRIPNRWPCAAKRKGKKIVTVLKVLGAGVRVTR